MLIVFIVLIVVLFMLLKFFTRAGTLQSAKAVLNFSKTATPDAVPTTQYRRVVHDHALQDEMLFDAVADTFFEYQLGTFDPVQGLEIQAEVLSRLPKGTQTELRQIDSEEWAIYWTFRQLSLEFLVGRYGIFYTHVDRFGQEHRLEFLEPEPINDKAS